MNTNFNLFGFFWKLKQNGHFHEAIHQKVNFCFDSLQIGRLINKKVGVYQKLEKSVIIYVPLLISKECE